MKPNSYFILSAMLTLSTMGLIAQSNAQLIANSLGEDANISSNFIEGMQQLEVLSRCDPWDDDGKCTDLCDPWDDRPCSQQLKTYSTSSPKEKETLIVKTMLHFEEAIAKGEGGVVLTTKLLKELKKKYPGNGFKPIKTRFKEFLKHLKSYK